MLVGKYTLSKCVPIKLRRQKSGAGGSGKIVSGGFESYFCLITISPLLFVLFFLGMFFGKMLKRNNEKSNEHETNNKLSVTVYPLLILVLSTSIERFFTEK